MKWYLIFLTVILSFSRLNATMFGIGVAFGAGAGNDFSAVEIQLPIDFGGRFRLEPTIGYHQTKGWKYIDDNSTLSIGTGVYLMNDLADDISIFYGGSFHYLRDDDDGSPTNGSGFRIRPTIGLEYSFSEKFRMGADIGYSYIKIGEVEWQGIGSQALLKIFF
jgi:hypothetical protein